MTPWQARSQLLAAKEQTTFDGVADAHPPNCLLPTATVQLVRPEMEQPDVSAAPLAQAAKAAGVAEKAVVKEAAVVTKQQAAAAVRVITTVRDRNNKTIDVSEEALPSC